MRTHGLTAHTPVRAYCSLTCACASVDVHARLVVQVKQVRGQTCLALLIRQVAAVQRIQIRLDLLCVCSHLDKTTTWHDPRLSQLQPAAAPQLSISGTPVHAHSLSNPAPTTQPQNINPETGITPNPLLSPSQSSFFSKHRSAFHCSTPSAAGLVFAGCDFFGIPFRSLHPRLW